MTSHVVDERRERTFAPLLIVVALAVVALLAFGVARAYGAFSYSSSTIGISSVQSIQVQKTQPADKLQLPSKSIAPETVAALAEPTAQTAVTKVEAPEPEVEAEAVVPAQETSNTATAVESHETETVVEPEPEPEPEPQPIYTSRALASWYDDAGSTASGEHYYYGIAHKYWAFGTEVQITYNGNTIIAVVDDRGPYYGNREIDLNQNCAAALGFDGVGYVEYVIL